MDIDRLMFPPNYCHNAFVAIHALGHMIYDCESVSFRSLRATYIYMYMYPYDRRLGISRSPVGKEVSVTKNK